MKSDNTLLALAAATALPVVLFATVMLFLYGCEREAAVEHDLRAKAAAATTAVERQIANEFGVLNALATSEALDRPDLEAFQAQARRALATLPSWLGISLADRTRQLMDSHTPLGDPLPRTVEEDGRSLLFDTGKPQVSGVMHMPERYPEPFVLVRVPVSRDGEVRFTLTATLRAYALAELLREQGVPEGWRIGIMDRNGALLARTVSTDPLDEALGESPGTPVPTGDAQTDSDIFQTESKDGFRATGAYVRSGLTGWTIIAGTATDAVLWAARRSVFAAAAGGLTAALCAAALAGGQIRAHGRRRQAERLMASVRTERAVADRLSDIAAHFPGLIYRRVLKDGVITYPYVSDCRHIFDELEGGRLTGGPFRNAAAASMTPETQARWRDALRVSVETGAPYAVELEVITPEGRRTLRSLAHTRREADGSIVWDGLVLDVTAQRNAEERSRVADERLRLAVGAADLGTFDLDIATRALSWSERCKAMFGLGPDDPVNGRVYLSRLHPDDVPAVRAAEDGALDPAGTGDYHMRFRVLWPDGTLRWLEATGKVIFIEDAGVRTPVRLIGTVMDITEAQRAESRLQEARDRAEQANLSKGKFLAAASHDLRQPLQSLFLFSAALHHHVVGERGREQLMHLERGLDALKGLLDSLLDVSRLDAGIIKPEMEEFRLDDLLDQVAAAYRTVAVGRGLALEVQPSGATVRSDRTLLGRMLRNLVENALRYTERGGVRVSCHASGGTLRIEIADSGIGIPPDHLDRIWEEFHQVGNTERDRTQGLGLGLAIVQRISGLLEHPVDVRSAPGRGSVFSITVPAAPAAAEVAPKAAPAVERGIGQFAVLVDDDAIVLLGLKAMFEEWGYQVLVAGSTDDALKRLERSGRRPDIVVADYRLREGRVGTEAILCIRQRWGETVPGIILTGETGPEAQRDATAHGLRVIHKPVTPRQLGKALDRHRTDAPTLPAALPTDRVPQTALPP